MNGVTKLFGHIGCDGVLSLWATEDNLNPMPFSFNSNARLRH
jgi:hypothetical protein